MNSNVNKTVLRVSGIVALVMAGSLLVLGVLELIVHAIFSPVDFIKAGERWSSDGEPYATLALYTEEGSAFKREQVEQYEQSINAALLSASVEEKERGSTWTYCYFSEGLRQVTGPKSSANADIIACGGDFFTFHPLRFLFGAPFLNDPSVPNGVVLDENLAWRIFGAIDVVGMTMTYGDEILTVSGITAAERNSNAYTHTYGEVGRMYMSYSAYYKINGDNAGITGLEVTLPNPVRSFARNIFTTAITVNEDTMSLAEVSSRYSIQNRFSSVSALPYSWARSDRIYYPYWENEARMIDYVCAIFMIFEVALTALAVSSMLLSFILLRVSGFTVTDVVKNSYKKYEASRQNRPKPQKRSKKIKRRKRRKPEAAVADDSEES